MGKKILVILLFCISTFVYAQQKTASVVHFKNGGVLKCNVLEMNLETNSVTLETGDGSHLFFKMDEIEKIQKDSSPAVVEDNVHSEALPLGKEYGSGYMTRVGRKLVLDDKDLSVEELRTLLTEKDYNVYCENANKGVGCVVAGVLTGVASLMMIIGAIESNSSSSQGVLLAMGCIGAVAADVFIPVGCVTGGIAKGNIARIADRYNSYGPKKTASYSFSPSEQRTASPVGGNGLAYGATFSISF